MITESASTAAVFASRRETLEGLARLQTSGARLDGVSVIGRESYSEQTSTGNYAARGCIEYSEYLGPFWSSIASVPKDLVLLYAPGMGLIRVGGDLAKQTIRAVKQDARIGSLTLMETGTVADWHSARQNHPLRVPDERRRDSADRCGPDE